jgi:hypothetical protein
MDRLLFTRPSKAERLRDIALAVTLGIIFAALMLHWFGVLVK